MNIQVNPHTIIITRYTDINVGEYNITKCSFTFSEEYEGLTKQAVFTTCSGTYKTPILSNECTIPGEVLVDSNDSILLGVYAYETNNDELVLRYSPKPQYFSILDGSYREGNDPDLPEPSEWEKVIEEVNEAIEEANNLNIEAEKEGETATITITKKDGSEQTVTLTDGTSLMFKWNGTELGIKTDDESEYTYVDLQGPIGLTPQLTIGNVTTGSPSAVTITGTDTNPVLNFTLEKGETGETGPTGNGIDRIELTATVGAVKTYTIYYTNGNTTTFDVTDGEVTEEQFNDEIDRLKMIYNLFPTTSASGTDLTLNGTGEVTLKNIDLKGNTSQANTILPSEYTQVEYIESTGTQYIDTGIMTSNLIRVQAKYKRATGVACLFGGRTDYNNNNYAYWTDGGSNKTRDIFGKPNTMWEPDLIDVSKIVYVDKNKNVTSITVDGETISHTYTDTTFSANYNIYLFGCNNAGSVMSQYIGGTIYYCKMYDNDVLVRDYVPCYRNSDNEVGLYDLVNGVFYTNAGTSTFTKGSNSALPNPDFPQDIHVVSGNNTIKVEGKNLFDKNNINELNVYLDTVNNKLVSNNNNKTIYISCKPNTIYTISKTPSKRFGVAYTYTAPANNTAIYGTITNYDGASITITTDTNAQYLVVWVINSNISGEISYQTAIDTLQIEYGNQVTTYQTYQIPQTYPINLGSIELCKIGNYQDYFYKQNNNWYLHKETQKVILDGTEDWSYTLETFLIGSFTNYRLGTINICICSHFISQASVSSTTEVLDKHITFRNDAGTRRIYIKDSSITSDTDFKVWLSSNNVTLYYVLGTPTYTQITDSTLISQLEALKNAYSYDTQTNVTQTNNDLPFILDITALEAIV